MTAAVEARRIRTFEPARPSRVVGETLLTPWASVAADLERSRTDRSWATGAALRSQALHRWASSVEDRADGLSDLIAREVGKPIREATAEVGRAVAILRYYAQAAYDPVGLELPPPPGARRLWVERRPVGTVLAVCPWNFPLAIPIWKVAPALAYGNRAVLRPSSSAIAVAAAIAESAAEALPPGVLHVWSGPVEDVESAALDPGVDAITFTGSVGVGRRLIATAARAGKPVQAEMGGHNAAIVLDDADVEAAARTIAGAAMAFAGQKCTATRRVVVHDSRAADLVDALLAEVQALRLGDPLDPETVVGPVISAAARSVATEALSRVPASRRIAGGGVSDPGWYMEPALVRVEDPREPIAQEETFAPIVSILTARDDGEAVDIANGTEFGLVGSVHGRDLERATSVAGAQDCGLKRINAPTTGVDFYAPFGGDGSSSYGPREQGRAIRAFVTRTRTITTAAS
jgi:aldehyde dehydrogenase (NAD+)